MHCKDLDGPQQSGRTGAHFHSQQILFWSGRDQEQRALRLFKQCRSGFPEEKIFAFWTPAHAHGDEIMSTPIEFAGDTLGYEAVENWLHEIDQGYFA